MKILAIETSCDETALSVIEASGGFRAPQIKIIAQVVSSQVSIHAPWGGVVPNLAKREHEKNLVPLLAQILKTKSLRFNFFKTRNDSKHLTEVEKILAKEPDLLREFLKNIPHIKPPKIDVIAVTQGPGLEPALWTGINFAKALALVWQKPLVPINHMEGHIFSSIIPKASSHQTQKLEGIKFPAIALLVSGGHTELILVKNWLHYKLIGRTRDDAVGEAFDKVARILELPYPGGPQISELATSAIETSNTDHYPLDPRHHSLPRPMLHSGDFDFSFSGLKTAVLYLVKKLGKLDKKQKAQIAKEFQDAVVEVITTKTLSAMEKYHAKTLLVGGGVIANTALRQSLIDASKDAPWSLSIPDLMLTGDNSVMIALATYFRLLDRRNKKTSKNNFGAVGNLSLTS